MDRRSMRPSMLDCPQCFGLGTELGEEEIARMRYCQDCGGGGMDAIPWSELFSKGIGST